MNGNSYTASRSSYYQLRKDWVRFVVLSILFLLGSFIVLLRFQNPAFAWRWLAISGPIAVFQFYFLFSHLGENRLKSEPGELFPALGLANWITSFRAILNATLAGFLINPWPEGWLAWAPGALYLVSILMDFADGYVARVTGQMTTLGETLDMQWDSVGVLIASILSVVYGQTPWLYITVGMARYLFVFGQWIRKIRHLPVYDLLPNNVRRPFAGTQMGFLAVVLMPVFSPPATMIAAWLLMVAFLANFLKDWISVSTPPAQISAVKKDRSAFSVRVWLSLSLIMRSLLVLLLVEFLVKIINNQPFNLILVVLTAFAALALLLGVAGRIFSLGVVIMTAFALQSAPSNWLYWAMWLVGFISMLVGTGRFSLWKPEDGILFKHVGKQRPAVKPQR